MVKENGFICAMQISPQNSILFIKGHMVDMNLTDIMRKQKYLRQRG
jgi:hypothetical protein